MESESQDAMLDMATKSTTTKSTTASAIAISGNAVGNGTTFVVGLITDLIVVAVCFIIHWWFKRQYPIMMVGNEYAGIAPKGPHIPSHEGFFGWMRVSYAVTLEDVWDSAGLDHAMLLQFT